MTETSWARQRPTELSLGVSGSDGRARRVCPGECQQTAHGGPCGMGERHVGGPGGTAGRRGHLLAGTISSPTWVPQQDCCFVLRLPVRRNSIHGNPCLQLLFSAQLCGFLGTSRSPGAVHTNTCKHEKKACWPLLVSRL